MISAETSAPPSTPCRSPVLVSVLIPIKNEASNLARCLASVRWAEEVVVVDSASTDGSQKIAADHGAQVVQFEFSGVAEELKSHCRARFVRATFPV